LGIVSLPSAASGMPTLDTFVVQQYLPWRASEHPASQYRILGIFANHLLPEFGALALDRISKSRAEAYKSRRALDGASAATIAKELRALQACLNRAVFLEIMSRNPIRGVRPPKDLRSRPPTVYTAAELDRLYAHSQHRHGDEAAKGLPPNGWPGWTPVWRLYVNLGLRRAEGLHLRWAHLTDDEARILSTEKERTKSGRWRAVPLSEGAKAALAALKPLTGATPHVLPRVHLDALTAAFRRCLARAGLAGSLHCLRHTFCATLVSSGVPLRTVQILAGHASITTTERYAHLSADHLQDAVRSLRL